MTKEHKLFLKKQKRKMVLTKFLQIGLFFFIIGLWELLAYFKIIDPFITSSPSRIILIIKKLINNQNLFNHILATVYETVLGFLISTTLGTLIAILLWSNKLIRDVLQPYIIVLNALPKVALGPIIIVWIGAGRKAIITMAVLISIIITIISMLAGFMAVEKEKLQLLKSMNANKVQVLKKLIIPANIPTLLSVLKINVGLSWVGTIMGEYLVSREGIGYLIVYGSQVFQLDLVMASTVILCILAALMYSGVALLEKVITKGY